MDIRVLPKVLLKQSRAAEASEHNVDDHDIGLSEASVSSTQILLLMLPTKSQISISFPPLYSVAKRRINGRRGIPYLSK